MGPKDTLKHDYRLSNSSKTANSKHEIVGNIISRRFRQPWVHKGAVTSITLHCRRDGEVNTRNTLKKIQSPISRAVNRLG